MTSNARMLPPPMSLCEAADLFDALRTAKDVVLGLSCQPRFRAGYGEYNTAGQFLDDLREMIGHAMDNIAEVAESATPDETSDDYASRAAILIADDLRCEGVVTAADRAMALYGQAEG
jgi:peptidoglycan/xylan/chitin deacetylase (PgdA/CDA1 family)